MKHEERKHARFSPSGFERIQACPGSATLSLGLPDKSTVAAKEGTLCHEVLERKLKGKPYADLKPDRNMVMYADQAASFILSAHKRAEGSDLLVETKVSLSFIHNDFWGSLDAAIVDHFGVLNIIDLKYGSHLVNPKENLQLLAYAVGVAHQYDWNFAKAKLTIIQPRARGYDGNPSFWELKISELRKYVSVFSKAIERAENEPETYNEGNWCFFCKAKTKCPLKQEDKLKKAKSVFGSVRER